MRKLIGVLAVSGLLAVPALAHWVPEDGHKMHFPQLPDEDGWDVYATYDKVLADDWTCSETGLIKDIHWWGSWKDMNGDNLGDVGTITTFHLSIHSNIVDGGQGYSVPGPVLWEEEFTPPPPVHCDPPAMEGWYNPNTGAYIQNDHGDYWQYNLFLPESLWFWQDQGAVYWLDISARVLETDRFWGWKTADVDRYPTPFTGSHYLDDAVWDHLINPTGWQELRDPITDESLDLAFVITPEPATFALVAFAGLVLAARRRR